MRTRLSTCRRKQRFLTEEEALLAAMRADIVLRIYRCDRCLCWHLTSRTKGKRLMGQNRNSPSNPK